MQTYKKAYYYYVKLLGCCTDCTMLRDTGDLTSHSKPHGYLIELPAKPEDRAVLALE